MYGQEKAQKGSLIYQILSSCHLLSSVLWVLGIYTHVVKTYAFLFLMDLTF